MSTNISKQKRDELINKIEQIRTFIQKSNNDENTTNLLQYLNELTKEVNGKKYGLVFEEHREKIDKLLDENMPVLTEEKNLFITNSGQMNFLIEGDNLASLQLLEKTHKGKIDVIYIDPPYNTGKEDFIYDDNYVDSDDTFKHSKWCSFITKRLEIAQHLIRDDGIIFISIDDNEYSSLKIICDDVFGDKNHLMTAYLQVRYDNKQTHTIEFLSTMENVLIYAKDKSLFHPDLPYEQYNCDKFVFEIVEKAKGSIYEINGDKVEVFKKNQWELIKNKTGNENYLKETWITGSIYSDISYGKIYQKIIEPRIAEDGYGSLYKIYGRGDDGRGYRYYTNPQKIDAKKGKTYSGIPLYRIKEMKEGDSKRYKPISNLYDFAADFGNIRNEGGVPFNSGKKPIKMIKQFLNYHKDKNITVLDFFAGSGSTGHAVLSLNADDGGHRKFILCTNNENNICKEITYKRIKNVLTKDNLPGSLKYYRVDFVPIKEKEYYEYADELLLHVKELVELENAVNFDGNKKIAIILTEPELFDFCSSLKEKNECKTVYIGHDLLLSKTQKNIFKEKKIKIKVIPEYYYPELNG